VTLAKRREPLVDHHGALMYLAGIAAHLLDGRRIGQWLMRVWPGAPRRVGAVGAARPARSAAGPGAAQRRRLIRYGSIRQWLRAVACVG
jgi:hypothetical protein